MFIRLGLAAAPVLAFVLVIVWTSLFSPPANSFPLRHADGWSPDYAAKFDVDVEQEDQQPVVCPYPQEGPNGTFVFPGASQWIVPGSLSRRDSIMTQTCCYNYIGNTLLARPVDFTGFQPIFFVSQNYSRDVFLYGYNDNDLTKIYFLNFTTCDHTIDLLVEVVDLTQFKIGEGEVIKSLVSDPFAPGAVQSINFLISQSTLHVNISNQLSSYLLPQSLTTFPDQTNSFTGAFYIGYTGEATDYIYLGRALDGNVTHPAEIVVFETNDDLGYIQYKTTVPLFSAPLNFLRPKHGTYVGEKECEFFAHQLLESRSYHLGNTCEYGYNIIQSADYEFMSLTKIDHWPTQNTSVLLLTGTSSETETGFEIFIYFPSENATVIMNSTEPYPDLVYVSASDEFGFPTELTFFAHDPVTLDGVYFVLDIDQKAIMPATENSNNFFAVNPNNTCNGTLADCCAGSSCRLCGTGLTCCQIVDATGVQSCNTCVNSSLISQQEEQQLYRPRYNLSPTPLRACPSIVPSSSRSRNTHERVAEVEVMPPQPLRVV